MKITVKSTKGFTLIELVIVIVIIGILATISVPIYRGYTRRAMAAEATSLAGAIANSEKVYFAEKGQYYAAAATGNDATLAIDATSNKYFTRFSVAQTGTAFTVTVTVPGAGNDASGIAVTLTQTNGSQPVLSTAGL
jgi:prepilin-type N-terminal cleavage/methylation domain-containing protein